LAFSLSWDIFWAFLMTILGFSGISEFYRICGFSVIFFQFFIAIFAIFGNWLFSCPIWQIPEEEFLKTSPIFGNYENCDNFW